MSNNTPPPELVENMAEAWIKPNSVQACAQIVVDYCFETFVPLNQQLKDIKQQRDELIEANKKLENQIKRDKKISEPYFLFFDWVMSGQNAEDAKKELRL